MIRQALERSWYRRQGAWLWLMPLSWLFGGIVALRRLAFRRGWLATTEFDVPVLVVGNITVGGSGKTPLTLALIERLQQRGRRVGVVSRGYGGHADHYPCLVDAGTTADQVGDEPLMMARSSGAAVAVDPNRPRAAHWLIAQAQVDFILADDGLQHYALARDAEIAVVDARRGLGNGWLLPAGPLREPATRLRNVDLSLAHGANADFWLRPGAARALASDSERALGAFAYRRVHAVAGIGDPGRFFDMLRGLRIDVIEHPLPDHHRFIADDICFADDLPVLMTSKDAIKCVGIADDRHWAVPVAVVFSATCEARVDALLDRLCGPATGTV